MYPDVFAGEERFAPQGSGFEPEWERVQRFEKEQERKEARREREAIKRRREDSPNDSRPTRRTTHSRLWHRLNKDAGLKVQKELATALASAVEDKTIPGNPNYKPETTKQHALRDKLLTDERTRVMSVDLPKGPLAEAARGYYPKKLEKEVYESLSKWKSMKTIPKKLTYYGQKAAKHAVDEAVGGFRESLKQQSLPKLQEAAMPTPWIKSVLENVDAKLYYGELPHIIREGGLLMLNRIKNLAEQEGGCERLQQLAGEEWNAKTCNRNSYGSWASLLFDHVRGKTVRELCDREWSQLACVLIRHQIEDWLRFASGISRSRTRISELRMRPRDLHIAAMAAKELGFLLSSSFDFFKNDLVTASSPH